MKKKKAKKKPVVGAVVLKVGGVAVDATLHSFETKVPPRPPAKVKGEMFSFEFEPLLRVPESPRVDPVTVEACEDCKAAPGRRVANAGDGLFGRAPVLCAACWRKRPPRYQFGGHSERMRAAQALVARVDTSLFAMPVRVVVKMSIFGDAQVSCEMLVPDRESPKDLLHLCWGVDLAEYPDPADEAAFLACLRRHLRALAEHELDEAIVVDGLRRFDPHAQPMEPLPRIGEKKKEGALPYKSAPERHFGAAVPILRQARCTGR